MALLSSAGILTANLISGDFEWTLANLLYYVEIIVLGPLLIYQALNLYS